MSTTDAAFFFSESANTPMHVGQVAVFEGPAPSYGDLVRLLLSKLPAVPRYTQRVRPLPLHLGRPVWVDDQRFQILYHVRHTAVPRPGGPEQLRNLAGRVLAQRLDMAKPLWENWLVEGLEDGRWALISKVHHCMIDGVAGTDLMQLMFDLDPSARPVEEPAEVTSVPAPSTASVLAASVRDAVSHPVKQLTALPRLNRVTETPRALLRSGAAVGTGLPGVARQVTTPAARSLNGPIGPNRRWLWSDLTLDDVKRARKGLGGTVNDVILATITRGFRDLLEARGELSERLVVRSMVPLSLRRPNERGTLNNQVSAVFVDLPVGETDPEARLTSVRRQMDRHKQTMGALDARSIIAMGDVVAPTLLALGTRAGVRVGQPWVQAVTTNVPGPRVPLYVLGRRLSSAYPYVPIAAGCRVSIGIFSYSGTMQFGVNADFDAFPDVDVLVDGIGRGLEELLAAADGTPATTG
ncbi:MAG TPA: wax ester/triacylglycerol synthase family O-acyltransferase [Nocardioidaceae bacterium]|nr:wax ester/triacylglycerol synthase family O-acyltransferase [Nocardioidaceae bacterium]